MALLADLPRPEARSDAPERRRPDGATLWVGGATVAYLALTLRWITGPVGLSHDGENLGVFAMGARGMSDLGLIASKGGSIQALGNGTYAHHPPLIIWLIYACQAVFGRHPWTARLPTAIGAVVAIWLLYGLLRDLRVAPWPAAIGTTVAVFSPMFLLYGWMADTPILALPFALGVARWWVRAGRDDLPLPVPTTVVLVTALGALAGWELSCWCGVLVVAAFVTRRAEPERWKVSQRVVVGVGIGLAIALGWIAISPDGVHGLISSFSTRTGGGSSAVSGSPIRDNLTNVVRLSVPLTLALSPFAIWLGARDRRTRQLLGLSALCLVGYAVLFWQASAIHDYWNEWLVLPLAIAFGAAASSAIDVGRGLGWRRPVLVVGGVAVLISIWAPLMSTDAQAQLTEGAQLGRDVEAVQLPADQPAWLTSGLPEPRQWVSYVGDAPVRTVTGRAQLDQLAIEHPDWWIIAGCRSSECVAMAVGGRRVSDVVVNRIDVVAEAVGRVG